MSFNYRGFPPYVSVAKRRAKAEKKLQALKKKNPSVSPVVIDGRSIANSWWGKSWNKNLERYADYENRIGRGRSYVRYSAVLDLQILNNMIRGLVQGSSSNPYSVEIKISKMSDSNWKSLQGSCHGAFDSLADLLAGKFPKSLQELFFNEKSGFFPSPKEIMFSCSCPDSASMCKHISATLYGVGARLDHEPALFFTMRSIDINELISKTVSQTKDALLAKADMSNANIIKDLDLSEVFGIEFDQSTSPENTKSKVPDKKKISKKPDGKKMKTKSPSPRKKSTK